MGATLNAAVYIDDTNADKTGYDAGFEIYHGMLNVGVHYLRATAGSVNMTANPAKYVRVHAKISEEGRWSALFAFEHENFDDGAMDDTNYFHVNATYHVSPKMMVAASLGIQDAGVAEGVGGSVGVFYQLYKRFQLHALVSSTNLDDKSMSVGDRTVVSAGMSISFGVGS
ncbi:MAG: hypothetical protein IH881_08265 [Myxococcales bacterium]|nr:hypothetical protein [Myxococcales bacterium]